MIAAETGASGWMIALGSSPCSFLRHESGLQGLLLAAALFLLPSHWLAVLPFVLLHGTHSLEAVVYIIPVDHLLLINLHPAVPSSTHYPGYHSMHIWLFLFSAGLLAVPTAGFYPYNRANPKGKGVNPLISRRQRPNHMSPSDPDPGGLGSVKLTMTRKATSVSVVPSLRPQDLTLTVSRVFILVPGAPKRPRPYHADQTRVFGVVVLRL